MKNIIKSKGERKMELYILMGLAAVIIILEAVILLKAKKDDGREQTDEKNEQNFRRMEGYVAGEFQRNRSETAESLKEMNALIRDIQEMNTKQSDKLNVTLTESVQRLQQSNEKKLDEMRQTVDEKLTDTLSKRLDSSFKVVSEQLKSVHESLGEMHKLAGSVGDLQRVLTNVKSRGTWAEVQLGNILEQTLTKEQYECNVSTKNDTKRVEFAIKIPSRTDEGKFVWLPIDSKFPQEDYIRICDAAENADKAAMEAATKALEQTVKNQAKTIAELYIDVPKTTDFAIMFLATEGLYAEVLRRPGLCEEIQTKYRVMICGPTTITAFLNTLRVGFRTIALDKKASEVWKVLGAVRTQYDKFEGLLFKVKKKIDEAGSTIEDAQKRNSIIQKNLKSVELIDSNEADSILGISSGDHFNGDL
mgnify:CR=1 FL=1